MPIRPVKRRGRDGVLRLIGYQYGGQKIYLIRRWGKREAYEKARRQGVAIKISQLRRMKI